MKKVGIIGLGEIGSAVFKNMMDKQTDDQIFAVDVDKAKITSYNEKGFSNINEEFPGPIDVYIIAVYSSEQVIDVIKKLDCSKHPLVIIESTLKPGTHKQILNLKTKSRRFRLVLFPHRYYASDPTKQVFNLHRILAGENNSTTLEALSFYKKYMDLSYIHTDGATLEYVELCKPMENAYRYIEIATAEQFYLLCKKKGLDFKILRDLMNTKWNINVMEPQEGIGKHCLPKDFRIIRQFFNNDQFFKTIEEVDANYRRAITAKKK